MDAASRAIDLSARRGSTTGGVTLNGEISRLSTTDPHPTRRRWASNTIGPPVAGRVIPYLTFLRETLGETYGVGVEGGMAYQWFFHKLATDRFSSIDVKPVVYRCFDFWPSPADQPRSLHTTTFTGSIQQHMPEKPGVSGVTRVIVAEFDALTGLPELLNEAGVYFKLPPQCFSSLRQVPEHEDGEAAAWSSSNAHREVLGFRSSIYSLVIQEVDFPGSEAAGMTCSKSGSRVPSDTHTVQSLSCLTLTRRCLTSL